jgi:hypothetical protein
MVVSARQLACCVAATLVLTVTGARPKQGDPGEPDWIAELRSVPKPTVDATGKYYTFSKHFVRNDPVTHTFTRLSYNCTSSKDYYVNMEESQYAVTNITCEGSKMFVTTASPEAMEQLEHGLAHSPNGLVFGGSTFMCVNSRSPTQGAIYRCSWRDIYCSDHVYSMNFIHTVDILPLHTAQGLLASCCLSLESRSTFC